MRLKDLFEQQNVIKGGVLIPSATTTLVGYKHNGIPIEGARVEGYFSCYSTKITSLEGAPSYVGGDFYCFNTKITSLEGAPSYVGGNFSCQDTNITSLEGAPSRVEGNFSCYNTKITSLYNVHKQIKHIGGILYLSSTVTSNIIGVMLIKRLQKIVFLHGNTQQKQVADIINKYLAGDRNVHDAQEELIEAGLAEYAKL